MNGVGQRVVTQEIAPAQGPSGRLPQGPADPHHLTGKQLARRWNISHRTVEKWRLLGVGPVFIRLGGTVRYRLIDVETFERRHLCIATPRRTADDFLEARAKPTSAEATDGEHACVIAAGRGRMK